MAPIPSAYEMSMGPLDALSLSEEGLEGSRKFLDRVYRLIMAKKSLRKTMVLSQGFTMKPLNLLLSKSNP